jgi:hypothetical protein
MKAIRDVHTFFQEESLKIKNNQPVIPYTAIVAHVCAAFEISEPSVRATLNEFQTCSSPGKKLCPQQT